MQIKIEIDVRPDELRRFVGLPDVAGLQDDVIQFVREKLAQASDSFDASAFVKNNLRYLSRNPLVTKLLAAAKPKSSSSDAAEPAETVASDVTSAGSQDGATGERTPKRSRTPKARRGSRAGAARKRARKRSKRTAASE